MPTITAAPMPAGGRRYVTVGITDEWDACDCCGRTNLKPAPARSPIRSPASAATPPPGRRSVRPPREIRW